MIVKLLALKNHVGFIRYLKNTSWLFAEKILRMFVGLFVGIWIARYLGPEQFGLLSYAQSFVGLFTALSTLGLDGIVVRELVKDDNHRDELMGTAFCLKLSGAFVVLSTLAIAIHFTSNDYITNVLVFIIASATIFQSFNVIDFYFQSKVMSRYVVFANMFSLFLSSIVKIVLILNSAPLVTFAWVILLDSFVLACGFIYFYLHNNLSIKLWKFDKNIASLLLKDSWPLMAAGVSFVLFSNIDTIMIKELLNEYYVGIYNAAYRLVTLWYFLPGLVLNSLLPSIVNAYEDKILFYKRIMLVSTFLVWISIGILIIYVLFENSIIAITYGKQYVESAQLLGSLSLVNILIFYNSLWNQWMMVENKTKRTLCFHVLTAILNIIMNYYFIQIYGVKGAIYALLLALSCTYIIFWFYDRRILKLFISSVLLEVLWKKNA